MTLGGADTINGEKATRILLVPKDPEILARVKKCELWISEKGWTVQQKFHTGGGDYVQQYVPLCLRVQFRIARQLSPDRCAQSA